MISIALTALIAGQLWITHSWTHFGRHFWLDEIYTHTLVTDPSLTHSLKALSGGAETHPPALYLLLRPVHAGVQLARRLVGHDLAGRFDDEVVLRAFALTCTILALLGLYACLRQCFAASVAFTAILALWSHPLIIEHAFDGRFYGPWLAAIVWYAYALARFREVGASRLWLVLIAVTGVLVTTLHYFGIISYVLVTGAEWWARRRLGVPAARGMLAASLGPLAFGLCLPMLVEQRSAISIGSWIEPIDWNRAVGFVSEVLLLPAAALLLIVAWLSREESVTATTSQDELLGLAALLLMPFLLVGLSYVLQPVYWPRYAFPAIAGLAAPAAYALSRTRKLWLAVLVLALIAVSSRELHRIASGWRQIDRSTDRLIADLHMKTRNDPIVFESQAQLYVVGHYAPALYSRSVLLDFERGEIGRSNNNRVFMRDLARRYAEFYPRPALLPWSQVRQWRHFFLVSANFGPNSTGMVVTGSYPGFRARPVAPELYELTALASASEKPDG
jgi:hypothetical protein